MDAEENNEIFNPDAAQTAPNAGYAVAPVAGEADSFGQQYGQQYQTQFAWIQDHNEISFQHKQIYIQHKQIYKNTVFH